MKKRWMLLIIVFSIQDALAGYYFHVPSSPATPFGLGRMELIPGVDSFEPEAVARDYCIQAATSALIRFDDHVRAAALSTLPESPVSSPWLPTAFPAVLPLKASQTLYRFAQNQCVRGYESSGVVQVELPEFSSFYAALFDLHGDRWVPEYRGTCALRRRNGGTF